jgi:putative selenium metabolism protein SsnA
MFIQAPYIITLNPEKPLLKDALIEIENGKIVSMEEGKSEPTAINYSGKVLMPGLINLHTHFYGNFARGISIPGEPPFGFGEILEKLWWRLDKVLDEESIKYSALMGLVDGIKSGVTTYFDHHASPNCVDGSLDIISNETINAGVRASLCYEVSDRDGDEVIKKGLRENERFISKAIKNHENINGMMGLHAALTLSDDTLLKAKEIENKYNSGFHIHVAEGIEDVDNSLSKYGMRVVERLHKLGITTENSIFAHCVHLNEKEIKLLADSKVLVSHQPESNLNNAVGFADIVSLMKNNVRVGIGTDGFCQGIWHSVRASFLMPKYLHRDNRVAWGEPIQLLMENSKKASSVFKVPVGILQKNSAADIIAIPYDAPTEMTSDNFFGHLLFGIMENPVTDVIVKGKEIMKDRKLLTIDEREVMAKSREICPKVWEKFNK